MCLRCAICFFFNDTATTEIYTYLHPLSLHDALPISMNTFGGHVWDAGQLIVHAIPGALKTGAKPGTPEFRAALRDALENIKNLSASQGVFNMSPTDHAGFDKRARVMIKVVEGRGEYHPDMNNAAVRWRGRGGPF